MKLPEKQIRYVDLPDVSEIFTDSVGSIIFDREGARIELCVTRMDQINPPKQPTARRYSACRLVLTPDAVLVLFNQLQGIINAIQQEGVVVKTETPKTGTKH